VPNAGLVPAFGAPALKVSAGASDVWMLEELVPFAPDATDAEIALVSGPSADELRAAAEARHAAELAAERERIAHEAYADGYADGEAAGRAAEVARLQSVVAAAEQALDRVREGEERWQGN